MSGEPNNHVHNNSHYHRRQAEEALKAAKLIEARRMAKGARYVPTGDRSWTLKYE